MARQYRITKPITPEQGEEAIREIKERTNVKEVTLSDDLTTLTVFADDDQYYPVLSTALNIFRRIVSTSCELIFSSFTYDD